MSVNQEMNKVNIASINYVLFQLKENKVMLHSEQRLQLEIITLNKLSQSHKDKYHKYSLICGS